MNEHAHLLHNSGWAPRASLVWRGQQPASAGRHPADEPRPSWRIVRCDIDRRPECGIDDPAFCAGNHSVCLAEQLLHADRAGGGRNVDDDEAEAEAELLRRLQRRIVALRLPAALPVEPLGTLPGEDTAECLATDIITVAALQSRTVGHILVRDSEPRLSRIELRAKALVPAPESDLDEHLYGGAPDPRLLDTSRTDIPWTFTWALRVFMSPQLAERIQSHHRRFERYTG